MFPIGDDQVQGGHKPIFTWIFIVINVLVFLYEASLGSELDGFLMQWGSVPADLLAGKNIYTLFTAMFLHGGWMHLIGNMLFLRVFGDNIEARIGSVKFVIFYLLGGVAAGLAHTALSPTSTIPAVGASGAIAAVLGAYLIMFPHGRIKMLFINTMQTMLIPAKQFLIYWIGTQFLSGMGSLANSGLEGGVAWWAHIGGFVFGVIAVMTGFIKRNPTSTISYSKKQTLNPTHEFTD